MWGVISNFFCLFLLPSKVFFKIKRENATTFYQYAKCSFFSKTCSVVFTVGLDDFKGFSDFFFTELWPEDRQTTFFILKHETLFSWNKNVETHLMQTNTDIRSTNFFSCIILNYSFLIPNAPFPLQVDLLKLTLSLQLLHHLREHIFLDNPDTYDYECFSIPFFYSEKH